MSKQKLQIIKVYIKEFKELKQEWFDNRKLLVKNIIIKKKRKNFIIYYDK